METNSITTLEDIQILFGRKLDYLQTENKAYKIYVAFLYLCDIAICCIMTYILTTYGTKFTYIFIGLITLGVFINVLISCSKKAENSSLYSFYKKYKKYEIEEKSINLNNITDKFVLSCLKNNFKKDNNTELSLENLDNMCCKKYELITKVGKLFSEQETTDSTENVVYLLHYKKKIFYIGRKEL